MSKDLVSMGMPVYNGEKFLEESIRSNLAQTYEDFELIISDNASEDATESICRDYATKDSRIRYVRNEHNIGAAQNYNRLFELAKGSYFRWTNADDLVHPKLVEKALRILDDQPSVAVAFGGTQLIDEAGQRIDDYDDRIEISLDLASSRYISFYQNSGLTNAIYGLMRSSAMAVTNLMGSGKLPAGDVSFLGAMSLQGKFERIPETLFYRRIHAGAYSSNPDPKAEAQFWTGSSATKNFGHWRAYGHDIQVICRTPTPVSDKIRAMYYVLRRMNWARTTLVGELKNAVLPRSG